MSCPAHDQKPVAILGAGSLGRLWGGYLPPGHAFFIRRRNSGDKPDSDALLHYHLTSPQGKTTACQVPVHPLHELPCPNMLMVTTKAGDALDALESVMPCLDSDVPVVLFQNGMGLQQTVASRWPGRPVLAASTTEGANRPDSDTVIHAGRGQTWIGGMSDAGKRCTGHVVRELSASGLVLREEPDIHQKLWDKLVVNAGINAFTAILDCPNGDILAEPRFLEHIDALCDEIATVMATETNDPLSSSEIRTRIQSVATSTARNTSSMRSDRQRGRKTEIDFINGYISDRGRKAGIQTPVNQMLTRQVKELTEV